MRKEGLNTNYVFLI